MTQRRSVLSRAAFEALVSAHHAAVYASSLRLVRDPAVALDVTQEVYLALLEGRLAPPSGPSVETERVLRWFAVRNALARLRGDANRRRREGGYAMGSDAERAQRAEQAGADQVAVEREERAALERAVAELPDELRVPLCLRFFESRTYAAIGAELALSESAVHERVQKALDRLRGRCTRSGRAALAGVLELRLSEAATHGASVAPPHVATRLLALQAGSTAAFSSLPLALVAFLALVAAGVTWLVRPAGGGASSAGALATPVGVRAAGEDVGTGPASSARAPVEFVAPASTGEVADASPRDARANSGADASGDAAVERRGELRGVLLDAEGRPAGARVVAAHSLEFEGKFPRWTALARTSTDGGFVLEVPVGDADGTNYHLAAEDGGLLELADRERVVRARAGERVDAGTVRLVPALADTPGPWTLDVAVVDERGSAVVDAVVVVHRRVRTAGSFGETTWEAGARVDATGRVHLAGEHVGPKRVSVDARDAGHRKLVLDLDLPSGAHARTLRLERALEIRGRLVDVDGRPIERPSDVPPHGSALAIHAIAPSDRGDWILGDVAADGTFVLRGLDPGTYELGLGGTHAWSPICRDGVAAGTSDVRIELKRADDPRALGDHCAEVHARLVDAASGAPVAAESDALEVVRLDPPWEPARAGGAPFAFADVAPLHLVERPVQRAFDGDVPAASDRFHANGLEGGSYLLVVRVPGFAPGFVGPLALRPRELRADLVVELRPPVALSGRVLDLEGKGVEGAWVRVGGVGPLTDAEFAAVDLDVATTDGRPRATRHALARTDAEGRFTIRGVPPGLVVTLAAFHARHEPGVSAARPAAAADDLELRLGRRR